MNYKETTMCEFIMTRGPKKGQKCTKNPKKGSEFCSVHSKKEKKVVSPPKSPDTPEIPQQEMLQEMAPAPVPAPSSTDFTFNIPNELFEKLNQDSLKEVCMSSVLDLLNLMKEQAGSTKKKFNINELDE